MKTLLLNVNILLFLLISCFLHAQETKQPISGLEQYKNIPPKKLLIIANEFYDKNDYKSALIGYNAIFNDLANVNDTTLAVALTRTGNIYYRNYNYKVALEFYFRALKKCETINYYDYIGKIYNNLGIIHIDFKGYEKALQYLQLAEKFVNPDEKFMIELNRGNIMTHIGAYDSAMYYYRKAFSLVNMSKSNRYDLLYSNMAHIHLYQKNYDSAFYYFKLALSKVEELQNKDYAKAEYLQNIGIFYYEINNYDSAYYYLDKSKIIADEINLLEVLSIDYFYRYEIEKEQGNKALALQFHEKYSALKDSIFNTERYGEINQLELAHDFEEYDKQIHQLNLEQEIKERTITLQRKIQIILSIVVLIIILILIFIYIQNRKLNNSYKILVDKNIEIVNTELQRNNEKTKSHTIDEELYNEIKTKILDVMNNDPIICNSDFSIYKLAEIVNSNQNYVSKIINDAFGKNFKSFVNSYRIKRALIFLQNEDFKKYKIESIASMVGFESRNSFDNVFKENVGVTPSFYISSLIKKESQAL